jgi:hypothetical protein
VIRNAAKLDVERTRLVSGSRERIHDMLRDAGRLDHDAALGVVG